MIHLPPLPGSSGEQQPISSVVEAALREAKVLADTGFDALMIENFGDAPFVSDNLEPATVAAMAIVVHHVKTAAKLPVGVNALRNDARSALGIAAAASADFIRVNVHVGVAATDQGFIQGRAPDTLRDRMRLAPQVGILADVHVKHATPINQPDIAAAAEETAYRGRADALVVSGVGTGKPTDPSHIEKIKAAVPDRPLFVGSGVTAETIRSILDLCDGAIVGTCIKKNGQTTAPVDPQLAAAFIQAARG